MSEIKTITNFELRLKEVDVATQPEHYGKHLGYVHDVSSIACSLIGDKVQEHFIIFLLDFQQRLLGYQVVAMGKQETVDIDHRILFRAAIQVGASYIICAHNHPMGNVNPSQADIYTTRVIQTIGDILGIVLVDHIIVSGNKSTSLNATGFLRNRAERDVVLRQIFNQ